MSDLTPAPMGAAEADARLARVRGHVTAAWDDLIELYLGRAWLSKGHESWAALCEAELDGARITLPRDERGQVVRRMAASGMSTRAIGQAIGVHHDTVADDIKRAPVGNPTPAPRHVDTTTGEITETAGAGEAPTRAGFTEDTSPAPATVTGLDGKTYTRPAPSVSTTPKRRPLTDAFLDATYDLTKAVERLARLVEDDRFPQNAEKAAQRNRGDLLRARDSLAGVIAVLNSSTGD